MNHHGLALRLPVELLSIIFNSLPLRDLLTSSHVSTFWRAVAQRHQTYWRDIELSAVSTTALDFFQARLAAGGHGTVTIRLLLAKIKFPVRHLHLAILPTLQHNLSRADRLVLDIDIAHEVDIFAALQHPAPQLHTFELAVRHGNRPSTAMPQELFACRAPNLRSVRLINILLHTDRLPHAFSAITALGYYSNQSASFPTAVFSRSQLLTQLEIYVKVLSLEIADNPPSPLQRNALQSLDVSVLAGAFDLVRRLQCASIATITAPMFDYASVHLLLRHLHGRLEARIYHTHDALYLEYRSLDTGRTRRFISPLTQISCASMPPIYLNDLTWRVQALHTSATASGLMPAFGELPACTRFALSIANGEPLRPPERPLSMPELQHIEVSSTTAARLTARDLTVFLNAAFTSLCRVVQVTLEGVSLEGDCAELSCDRFILSTGRAAPSAPS